RLRELFPEPCQCHRGPSRRATPKGQRWTWTSVPGCGHHSRLKHNSIVTKLRLKLSAGRPSEASLLVNVTRRSAARTPSQEEMIRMRALVQVGHVGRRARIHGDVCAEAEAARVEDWKIAHTPDRDRADVSIQVRMRELGR